MRPFYFSLFLICLTMLELVSASGNKYLKLKKFDYETGRKIGTKNKEKYFTKEMLMKGLAQRFQKIMMNHDKKKKKPKRKIMIEDSVNVVRSNSPSPKRSFKVTQKERKIRAYQELEKSADFDQIRDQIVNSFRTKNNKQDVFAPGQFDFKKPKTHNIVIDDGLQTQKNQNFRGNPQVIKFQDMKGLKPFEIFGANPNFTNNAGFVQKNNRASQNTKVSPAKNSSQPKSKPVNLDDWEKQANQYAIKFLNDFRKQNGCAAVQWDDVVFNATRPHTASQMRLGKISHDGFNDRADQISRFFFVRQSAENVAYFSGYEERSPEFTARKLTDQWINSAGHRKNMLLPNITHAAISLMKKGTGQTSYFGTQFFVRK